MIFIYDNDKDDGGPVLEEFVSPSDSLATL